MAFWFASRPASRRQALNGSRAAAGLLSSLQPLRLLLLRVPLQGRGLGTGALQSTCGHLPRAADAAAMPTASGPRALG